MKQPEITWITCKDVVELTPWNSTVQVYDMTNKFAFPHWRPAGNKQRGLLFPKEVVQAWLSGEQIPDHWLMGRLATDLPPDPRAVAAVEPDPAQSKNQHESA